MLLNRVILFAITLGYAYCADRCPYINSFGKKEYRLCDSGCCGDLHNAYCCHHQHLTEIVFGSVAGFFLLVAVIVVVIHCCYRRRLVKFQRFRVTRNYGTISVPDGPIVTDVDITVTPATPEPKEESILRPVSEPPAISVIIEESTDTEEADDSTGPEVEISVTEEAPLVIIETEDTMGNENRPASRVDDDVQPYRPDNPAGRVDGDVQPYYPGNPSYPDNQPYYPAPQPDVQPYPPDVQPYTPDVQPYAPDVQPYAPDVQPYNPNTDVQPYYPDDDQPYRPDNQPYQPDVQPYTPDVQPYPDPYPAGMVEEDVEPYTPDIEPYVPDDEPYDRDDQPY